MQSQHPWRFDDERTPIDSSRYAKPIPILLTGIGTILFFIVVWPIVRLLDWRYRRNAITKTK